MSVVLFSLLIGWGNLLFHAATDTLPDPPTPSVPDTTEVIDPGFDFDPDELSKEELEELMAQQEEEAEPEPPVYPLERFRPVGFNEVINDSLMRWEQWYNLAERENRRTGAITFRLGAQGRNDGIMFRATDPRHRRTYFEGIPFNDPVSGSMNAVRLPLDRMRYYGEQSSGIVYRSDFEMQRFYVLEPLTWINFEETRDNERRAEGILTANVNRRMNVELAYKGINHDGGYPRSRLSGRQASVRVSYFLNDNWLTSAMLFYNSVQMQESRGYNIQDLAFFPFEPFFTTPVDPNARSSMRNSLIALSAYYRPDVDSEPTSRFHVYHHRYRRFFAAADDRSNYQPRAWGLNATHRISLSGLELEPYANLEAVRMDEDTNESLRLNAWETVMGGSRLRFTPADNLSIRGWGELSYRSDKRTGWETGYEVGFGLTNRFTIEHSLAFGQIKPTLQHRYWLTEEYSGNFDLESEQIARIQLGLVYSHSWINAAGIRVYGSEISNPIVLSPFTGQFESIDSYQSVGSELFFEVNTKNLEMNLSSTVQTYLSDSGRNENQFLDQSGYKFWNRASIYLKNYFFDFATFAKVGVSGIFSPTAYYSHEYDPLLDYWNQISIQDQVPWFYRVDLEASARVRNAFFLFKYENLLQNVGKAGYFESAPYPMPGRRFRIGVRWILRN